MPRFVEGEPRTQATLFPERIEDYIDADNPVRAIEAFVDALDLDQLGFHGMTPKATGRPAYHPGNDAKHVQLPAQPNKLSTHLSDRCTVASPEIGNGLKIRSQSTQQPHQLNIAARFSFQTTSGLDAIQIAINVQL